MTADWKQEAMAAWQSAEYGRAATLFSQAAEALAAAGNALDAAEARNNQAVALLQMDEAQAALQLVQPTLKIFEQAGDLRRLGMAWGNLGTALDELGRLDEARAAYQKAADLLAQAGEDELRAVVLKSLAAAQLKQGKMTDSAFAMLEQMGANPKLPWWQRLLRKVVAWVMR